jgi:hypothetical protein
MPQLRAPDGSIVNVPDEQASTLLAGGYQPVNIAEAGAVTAAEERPTSGALAPIGAAASSFLSGATLGLSDLALKGMLDQGAYKRLAADREAHPFVSGAGQLAGALVGGPTPAGALNEATAAASAGRGIGARIAADAAAGSVYSAGAYLSDSALSDREMSAEGLRAALGAGFEFGAAGGAAALGIEKGTIAARRMFSRLSDGTERAANEAEQAWRAKHQATLEANDAAAEMARAKLAETSLARQQAQLAQQRAAAGLADARLPQPVAPVEAPGGIPGAGGAAPGAPVPPGSAAVPAPPLDEQIAGVLNDRAHVGLQPGVVDPRAAAIDQQAAELLAQRGGEATQVTGPSFKPGDPGFRFAYSSKGGGGNALDLLAEQPGVVTRGPAELGRVPGSLPPEAEAELTAALRDHDAARSELDDLLARIGAPEVQSPALVRQAVPVGEFGAPGAGGFKSQDELARLAAGTGQDEGAIASRADITGAGGPRALRGGARGTPVEQPPTAVGKRPPAAAVEHPPAGEAAVESDLPAAMPTSNPKRVAAAKKAAAASLERRREIHSAAASNLPQELQLAWDKEGYKFMQEEAARIRGKKDPISAASDISEAFAEKYGSASETGKGYEGDRYHRRLEIEAKHSESWAKEQGRRFNQEAKRAEAARVSDQADQLAQIAEGSKRSIDDVTELFHERAAIHEFEGGTPRADAERMALDDVANMMRGTSERAAAPATDTLTGQLRDMQQKLGAGEDLVAMGEPARDAYRAAKAERTAAAAEHFRGRAIAAREARAGAVAAGETPNPFHEPIGGGPEMDQFFRNLTAPKTRDAYVAQNIGRAMREEGSHAAGLARLEREWAERGAAGQVAVSAPSSWRDFQAERMAEYMRSEGGHAGAMKRLGKEWGEVKAARDRGVRQLEQAHDAAMERAATATDPAERAEASQEAQVIEQQLTAVGARPGAVEDVAAVAPVVTRYERASARLAEALGEEAPPAAKEAAQAFRAAEDAADRKTLDRATRAIDDHVEGTRSGKRPPVVDQRPVTSAADWNDQRVKQGLGDALAPPARGEAANPRIAAAKTAKLRADAGLAHARAAETEAKIGAGTSKRTAAEYRAAAEAERPGAIATAPAESSRLGSVLTAVAAAGELGIPGIPHPKDIPVVGPLLSLWTKYRIAKAMVGRFAGRVAATGDARAAAFAARAKDKVAAAVDRTLGLAAEVAPKARAPIVATAAVLGHRLIDDGEPDAPKGASAQELAAVRIREIAAAASRPDLVVGMVRQQLGGVTDPDLITAAEQVLMQQFQHLAGVMPKLPPPNPYARQQFVPSPAAAADLADRIGVMHDPASAFSDPNPAKADALANFYPKLFAVAQQRLAERASELKEPMSNRQQLIASLIFRVPVATSMEPGRLAVLQSAHVALRTAMQPTSAPQPDAPPTPAVAQPTNLNQLYQTGADRRAARM